MSEKIKEFIEGSLGYLAAALVAVAYVATGLLVPGLNDRALVDIVRDGAVGFVLGVALNFCLNLQGILKGKRSDQLQRTVKALGVAVTEIEPYIHRLDGWCEQENDKALQRERTRILAAAALRYSDCFDAAGNPLDVDFSACRKEVREERRAAFKKAIKLQLTPLSAASLTAEGGKAGDPHYFGETVEEYELRTNLKDAVSKLLIAAAFGYFGVEMVLCFDVGALIWRCLYVTLLLALGTVKMLRSYLFITDTYRGNIVKRINYLQSFKNWAQNTPEKLHIEKKENQNGNNDGKQALHTGELPRSEREGAGTGEGGEKASGESQQHEAAKIPGQ